MTAGLWLLLGGVLGLLVAYWRRERRPMLPGPMSEAWRLNQLYTEGKQ